MKKLIRRLFNFLSHGVWTIDESKLNRTNRYLVKLVRIIIIAVEDFGTKKLILQASALTFYSLLSLVPVVAMIFGIAKGFGLEETLEQQLYLSFKEQPALLEQLLGFVHRMLADTQGGLVAGFGFVILIWSVLQVLSSIEESFNSIWQITTSRSWIRKFTDYLSILLLAPIFIIAAGSATLFISAFIKEFADAWIQIDTLRKLVVFSINLIPYVLNAILFMLLYMVMPNTRVRPLSALVAGIVAGVSYQLFLWAYIEFQFGVSRYNAIYGSFAFFPLFIVFLQVSWIIVLIGGEISYSLQNIDLHVDDRLHFVPSHKERITLAVAVMSLTAHRFKLGEPAFTAQEISQKTHVPYKVMKEFCNDLCRAGLLSEINAKKEEHENSYQPAIDIDRIDVSFIISKLENLVIGQRMMQLPPELNAASNLIEKKYLSEEKAEWNLHVLDINIEPSKKESD